jgi:hypothetical protein
VHSVSNVRKIVIHTAEPFVSDSSLVEVEIAIGKFDRYKMPSSVQMLEELFQAEGETLWSEIYTFIYSIRNKEESME